jgi:hypothetical protein
MALWSLRGVLSKLKHFSVFFQHTESKLPGFEFKIHKFFGRFFIKTKEPCNTAKYPGKQTVFHSPHSAQ